MPGKRATLTSYLSPSKDWRNFKPFDMPKKAGDPGYYRTDVADWHVDLGGTSSAPPTTFTDADLNAYGAAKYGVKLHPNVTVRRKKRSNLKKKGTKKPKKRVSFSGSTDGRPKPRPRKRKNRDLRTMMRKNRDLRTMVRKGQPKNTYMGKLGDYVKARKNKRPGAGMWLDRKTTLHSLIGRLNWSKVPLYDLLWK